MSTESQAVANALRRHLERLKALRGMDAAIGKRLKDLKDWQARRLARTYADLASIPRYRAATAFFLQDLYGPKDFSARDAAMLRIVPVMTRILPVHAVETAALSIEVEAISEELDHQLAATLPDGAIDEDTYGRAYREIGNAADRKHQIQLVVEVGRRLDALVAFPFVFSTLKLMRHPARLAGLSELQDFLERGFVAFRAMGGADEFLATIESRETTILNRLFSGAPRPFSL